MATPPRRWSEADDRTLRDLHSQGRSLHSIAAEMNRGKDTISKYAGRAGLSFSRVGTEQATQASVADAKSRQARIRLDLLGDIEQARLRIARADSARDFQAIGQGFAAVMRAYTDFVRTLPEETGMDMAKSMLGRIYLAIAASVDQETPLNPTSGEPA